MSKLKTFLFALLISGVARAGGYDLPRLCPEELKSWIFQGKRVAVADVQSPEAFGEHNYEGSASTGGDEGALLVFALANASGDYPVVVVGEEGGEGDFAAARVLCEGGVDKSRLYVLKGGMKEALAKAGKCDCCKVGEAAK